MGFLYRDVGVGPFSGTGILLLPYVLLHSCPAMLYDRLTTVRTAALLLYCCSGLVGGWWVGGG